VSHQRHRDDRHRLFALRRRDRSRWRSHAQLLSPPKEPFVLRIGGVELEVGDQFEEAALRRLVGVRRNVVGSLADTAAAAPITRYGAPDPLWRFVLPSTLRPGFT
jgi:hypothetical protein